MTPDALARARALIDRGGLEAFSFDVFDTFLLRRCTTPDGVFELAFALAPIPGNRRMPVESFVQHRQVAEQKARRLKFVQTGAAEVTIDEIYQQFPVALFGLDASGRAGLADAEFRAERQLCFVNRDIAELYAYARAAGLRTGFLSDTYWSRAQLKSLLLGMEPYLETDFLYASCDDGRGKAHGLFSAFLEEGGLAAVRVGHIGDNPVADGTAPQALGVATVAYPQSSARYQAIVARERTLLQMIQSQRGGVSLRLDAGLGALRRLAAAKLPDRAPLHRLIGTVVLGPLMVGFQRFAAERIAEISRPGRTVKVMFLARDGFLPFEVWERARAGEARYVELNRRVALVGANDDIEPLQDMFRGMRAVNATAIDGFLKAGIEEVEQFFAEQPAAWTTGAYFADAMPDLIGPEKMRELSQATRTQLLTYLRAMVPGFDDATDFVIVDLGYSGTIQRAFRGVLDRAGLTQRLHGVYLSTVDENFAVLPEGDSATGFVDDTVLTPVAKRVLLRNISLIEQFCCAPVGSVLSYDGADVLREDEVRAPAQIALCAEIQQACLDFVDLEASGRGGLDIDPFQDLERNRVWAAAILCRFVLLPGQEEQDLFGALKQDVNLGSRVLVDMIDLPRIEAMLQALPLPIASIASEPPMWLAGSMAAAAPLAGLAYTASGFGLVPSDLMADAGIGHVDVVVIKDGAGETISVACMMTGFGEIRLRIPILRRHTDSVIAIPLDKFMNAGAIRALTRQQGQTSFSTMMSRGIETLPMSSVRTLRAHSEGGRFRRTGPDGHLLLDVPASHEPISLLTLLVAPLQDAA
jgi:FMN phosphatase YigB (HAD superfamily)